MKKLFSILNVPVVKVVSIRVPIDARAEDLFFYDIRHSDDDGFEPATIEKNVFVNHLGTLITTEPIKELETKSNRNPNNAFVKDNFHELSEEESLLILQHI